MPPTMIPINTFDLVVILILRLLTERGDPTFFRKKEASSNQLISIQFAVTAIQA